MREAKTRPTTASVAAYLNAIADEPRRRDCKALAALMRKVTGCTPRMWGPSIVGFGSYHYKYASGHEGDACLLGFSSRKGDISVYLVPGWEGAGPLLAKLGKHRMGKGCLYLRRLDGVDLAVLEQLLAGSVAETRRRYPTGGIDGYIAGFPPEVQEILQRIRAMIRAAAPEAEEAMKYQIPTFVLNGNLVHFAAFKQHIGFYPTPSGIEAFKDALAGYEVAKGSVRFPLDREIPLGLMEEIVRFRVEEVRAGARTGKKRR